MSIDYLLNWLIQLFKEDLDNALKAVYGSFISYLNISLKWSDKMITNTQKLKSDMDLITNLLDQARNDAEVQYPLSIIKSTVLYRYEVFMGLLPQFLDLIIDSHGAVSDALRRLRLISITVILILIIMVIFAPIYATYIPQLMELHEVMYIMYLTLACMAMLSLLYSLIYIEYIIRSIRKRLQKLEKTMMEAMP